MSEPGKESQALPHRVGFLMGIYAACVGLSAILGWAFNVKALAAWGKAIAMQPNTALCALLGGCALIAFLCRRRNLSIAFAAPVGLVGCATFVEHAAGIDLGIDSVLTFDREWGYVATVAPGRMGVPAAVCYSLLGLALAFACFSNRTPRVVPIAGIVLVAISSLSLVGYAFNAAAMFSAPAFTAIAFQTATVIFALGIGLVAAAPAHQPMSLLLEGSAAGAVFRRALPFVIVLPVFLAWLRTKGEEAGLYGTVFGRALLVLLLTGVLLALLWNCVLIIRRYEERQRAAEEGLNAAIARERGANKAKSEFLANMSHEIRTPMNAIIGLSNILATSKPLTDKQRKFVGVLQESSNSLIELINDLLDISRIEAQGLELTKSAFRLSELVESVVEMMQARALEKGLSIAFDVTDIAGNVFVGDELRIRQILQNFCSNAVKFTEKGHIGISARIRSVDETPEGEMAYVAIDVTDTGIGVAPEKQQMIFEKFTQADASISRTYGGTGLGLAIAKTLAELMGGVIELQSLPGQGSTFTAVLPLMLERRQASRDQSDISRFGSRSAGHILLVEDNDANALVATTLLEQFGYTFDVASNGNAALAKVQANHYDLVLMDLQMPGMSGLEVTSHIREREAMRGVRRHYIVGMTAHALTGDKERCLQVGMDDYISKPFNPDELHAKLHEALKPVLVT